MNIYDNIIKLFRNDYNAFPGVIEILNSLPISYKTSRKSINNNLLLSNKEQLGGKKENIIIANNEYYYNVETAIPINISNANYELSLITLNDTANSCAIILFDKNSKEARIQSLSNYSSCIICSNPKIKYKVGDILMQIILYICKIIKVKKISLKDNSIKQFTGYSIRLLYFRTITKGEPYYCKFGFKNASTPITIRNNKEVWKTNPLISKKDIMLILNEYLDIANNKKLYDTVNKSFEKFNNDNISASEYCNLLYELTENEEKQIDILRNQYIKKGKEFNKINIHAWLILLILKDLYIKLGYKLLPDDTFVLYL